MIDYNSIFARHSNQIEIHFIITILVPLWKFIM